MEGSWDAPHSPLSQRPARGKILTTRASLAVRAAEAAATVDASPPSRDRPNTVPSESPEDGPTLTADAHRLSRNQKTHRRSKSAGSMKSITGLAAMGNSTGNVPQQQQQQQQQQFKAAQSAAGGVGSGVVSKPSVGATKTLVKQKSTLSKFLTMRKTTEDAPQLEDEQDVELMLYYVLAGSHSKPKVIKILSTDSVKDVLDAVLQKLSANKLKKLYARRNLPATASRDNIALFMPVVAGSSSENAAEAVELVWMKGSVPISCYCIDGEIADTVVVDSLPSVPLSGLPVKLVVGQRIYFVNLSEDELVHTAVLKCCNVSDSGSFSPSTHQLYCRAVDSREKGFWLDSQWTVGSYQLFPGTEVELREPDYVVLATLQGERFILDGSTTGETFLRAQLARLNLANAPGYFCLCKEEEGKSDLLELPSWQAVSNIGFKVGQIVHVCRMDEGDAVPTSLLPFAVQVVALGGASSSSASDAGVSEPQTPMLDRSSAVFDDAVVPAEAGKRDWHGFLKLYEQEDVLVRADAVELNSHVGVLAVTNAGIVFRSETAYLRLFYGMIARIDRSKQKRKKGGSVIDGLSLKFACKDFLEVHFFLPKNAPKSFVETLVMLAFPKESSQLYAFAYKLPPSIVPNPQAPDGWKYYEGASFYQRMGVGTPGSEWVVSDINANYALCDTYPAVLAVPASVTQETLRGSASFRSRGRLPALSYLHRNGASITRCSQPKVGLIGGSSGGDQILLQAILEANPNKDARVLRLIDARPKLNAMANQAMGKGSERTFHYSFECTLEYCNIDNIHVMRQSLSKLHEACVSSVQGLIDWTTWSNLLSSSQWLQHVHKVLSAGVKVARYIEVEKQCVVLHCSDGWDRTAQLSSLAMILLNPFYRTLRGFAELVEKEWLAFGHQFARRHGHADGKMDQDGDSQRSPVFFQFLDCVWQLCNLNPCAMEFNSAFLIALADEVYNCRFGTFLYDCERDRRAIQQSTVSVWTYLFSPAVIDLYRNPFFKQSLEPILMEVAPHSVQLWSDYHCRSALKMKELSDDNMFMDNVMSAETRGREMAVKLEFSRLAVQKKPEPKE